MQSPEQPPLTIEINTSIEGDRLSFNPDGPNMVKEGEVIVIRDVMIRTPVRLVVRDLNTLSGEFRISAIGTLASMTGGAAADELRFDRQTGGCASALITTPHKVKHTQEIEAVVLAWAAKVTPTPLNLGNAPRTVSGRLPIKIIRVPDGGG